MKCPIASHGCRILYNLLYVDDEDSLLDLTKLYMERSGEFSVDTATSAKEAIGMLVKRPYAAIISDYQMPEMNGIEFLKKIRTSGNTIPFILFTGRGREEIVIQALNEGADFYLQKGGEPQSQFTELAHQIRQAVQQRKAETSIRDLERREADIINFLPDATFAIDTKGVVIAWNRAIEEMTGVSAAAILGKGDYEYSIPFYGQRQPILINQIYESDEIIAKKYTHIIHKKDVLIADTTLPHPNGKPVTLMGKASPLYNRQGEIIGAIESIRDITEQKKVEGALQESEKRFRELADLLPQVVYEADTDGNLTYANHTAFERFGYIENDFKQGLNIWQMLAPDDLKRVSADFRTMIEGKGGTEHTGEYMALRKDGSMFPVTIYSSPIVVNGRITGLRGIIVDITERKRAEEALRESEERYRRLIAQSFDAVVIHQDGSVVFANDAAARLVKAKSPAEMIRHATLDFVDPAFFGIVSGRIKAMVETPAAAVPLIEERFRCLDGTAVDVEVIATAAVYEGKPAVQVVARDISGRKRTEEALWAANRQLNILNSITRHDIRNQLIALRSAIDLIDRDPLDPKTRKLIDIAEKAAQTINGQIEFTKEYEQLGLKEPRWQNVSEVFRHALLQFLIGDISIDMPADEYEIFADPLLEKVFYNLIDNAFRHGGNVTRISLSCQEEDGGLTIFMQDNGQGIPDEDKRLIFEKNFGRNTGLGLFLSREILLITGISIIESGMLGQGARFELMIPNGTWRLVKTGHKR